MEGVGAVLGVDGAEISRAPAVAEAAGAEPEELPRGMNTTAATATAKTNPKPPMSPAKRRARFGSVAVPSPASSDSASDRSASTTGTRTPISWSRMADGFLLLMRTGSGPA